MTDPALQRRKAIAMWWRGRSLIDIGNALSLTQAEVRRLLFAEVPGPSEVAA